MDTENKSLAETNQSSGSNYWKESRSSVSGRIFGGVVVVAVGLILLARQLGVDFPFWLISWEMLLIALGVYIGFRHTFRGPAWIILILVGTVLLLDDIDPSLSMKEYIWPIVIIAIGLIIIFRPQKKHVTNMKSSDSPPTPTETAGSDEMLDSVAIFGGLKKNIFSKNFRGGEVVTVFGGTEINLTQADITHRVELEITQIFAGAKIIVPPHWRIQSDDIVSIFGGIDDKRPPMPNVTYSDEKVLVIKGTNIFGGIDIRSF